MQETSSPLERQYTVLVFAEEDAWVAFVPALDIATQGESQEHAVEMARDAIELWITVAREHGEDIPVVHGPASMHQVAVTVG
jgi:predicted RNase H-like HicB family nuclease